MLDFKILRTVKQISNPSCIESSSNKTSYLAGNPGGAFFFADLFFARFFLFKIFSWKSVTMKHVGSYYLLENSKKDQE